MKYKHKQLILKLLCRFGIHIILPQTYCPVCDLNNANVIVDKIVSGGRIYRVQVCFCKRKVKQTPYLHGGILRCNVI
jgi:hypothetical protein